LAIWRGDEYILSFCSLFSFSFGRRVTPSRRTNNNTLYLQSSAALGWTSNEYRHIANASALYATGSTLVRGGFVFVSLVY
jgi:hypothetical protein